MFLYWDMIDFKITYWFCNQCDHEWESVSVYDKEESEVCPNCGGFDTRESEVSRPLEEEAEKNPLH